MAERFAVADDEQNAPPSAFTLLKTLIVQRISTLPRVDCTEGLAFLAVGEYLSAT
jgi:hypothetical protein